MKLRLLEFLVCPHCRGKFSLHQTKIERNSFAEEDLAKVIASTAQRKAAKGETNSVDAREGFLTEIISGDLTCTGCGDKYPIEGGIPRLLPPSLRTVKGMGRGDPRSDARLTRFLDEAPPIEDASEFNQVQLANQSNYGYEWQAFSHEYRAWDSIYIRDYVKRPESFFIGQLGLDAGCGNGRYTAPAARLGAEMIGVDLSNAIEIAYRRSREVAGLHVVQGDLFNLPFLDGNFDFAQSLGVIHITPDPERALASIKRTIRKDGEIFVMVYKTFEEDNLFKHIMLKPVNFLRRFTTKMSSEVLYWVLMALTPIVILTCYLPSWLLWHIPFARKWSSILPYSYEQYRGRRLRDIHMNLFDRFGNPLERRYTRQDMERWMSKYSFKKFHLDRGDAWIVTATN